MKRPFLFFGGLVDDRAASLDEIRCLREDVSALCEEYQFAHTTIEIEWGDDECRMGERHTGP